MSSNNFWQRFISFNKETPIQENGCFWQVDIHSHLIPNLDDGVSNLEETVTCLKQLSNWGIQKVITTPHVNRDWYPNTTAMIKQGLKTVQQFVADQQLPLTVSVAAEYMLDDFFLDQLRKGDLLSFGEKQYLLIEAGWFTAPFGIADILVQIQKRGYTPVLAHPERYAYYHNDANTLAYLRELGCLFQLNWMSICRRYGSRVEKQARYLLQQRWVDFIGSDIHRSDDLKTMARLFNASDRRLLEEQPLLNATL